MSQEIQHGDRGTQRRGILPSCHLSVRSGHIHDERGVTYLMVMCLIVLIGISLMVVGKQWAMMMKRDREAELLFRGNRIKAALEAYGAEYQVRKGTRPNQYPVTMEQLTQPPKPYLQKIYKDPITGDEFDLIKINGEIRGVKSRSKDAPLNVVQFKQAATYNQMLFQAVAPAIPLCAPSANPVNPLAPGMCQTAIPTSVSPAQAGPANSSDAQGPR
jgi:type II secretory pathway pseudopilin PulG